MEILVEIDTAWSSRDTLLDPPPLDIVIIDRSESVGAADRRIRRCCSSVVDFANSDRCRT